MSHGRHLSKAAQFHLILFGILVLAEGLVFLLVGTRHYTWLYPRWHDQVQYLSEAYAGYDYMQANGIWDGLWRALLGPAAQGAVHDVWAMLMFLLLGPSRQAALAVNMVAFLAWQAALFLAVHDRFHSWATAWISAGLLLALASPWAGNAGSTMDYRLDSMAASLMGVTVATAMMARGFTHRWWSAAFGAAVGLTLLTRFLSGAFFLVIFVGLLAWLLFTRERRERLHNLLIAGLVAAAMAGPIMWINRLHIVNYYWLGHFVGNEASLRNEDLGLGPSIISLIASFVRPHLGAMWLALATGLFLVLAYYFFLARRDALVSFKASNAVVLHWVLGSVLFLGPALVLALHEQKSPVVPSILMPGLVLLMLTTWHWGSRLVPHRKQGIVAAIVVGCAVLLFGERMISNPHSPAFIADATKVNQLSDRLFEVTRNGGIIAPRISVDQVSDALDAPILRLICYERKGTWGPFIQMLPTNIAAMDEQQVFERLRNSDVVFLTIAGPIGPWPFDRQMRAMLSKTKTWADLNLALIDSFTLFGQTIAMYQRREVPLAREAR